jgi:peptide/nickel transport system substrate-binding protein
MQMQLSGLLIFVKELNFHDGSDFDAEDVKYSLMRVKDPEIGSPAKKSLSVVTDIEGN